MLDRTVFYPGGGGQPSDRGLLLRASDGRRWRVAGARKDGADIVHELDPDPAGSSAEPGEPPAVGDRLEVDLDWARRHALMRTHTALHALCGVVWRDYGASVTGGNMEPGSGRMDFEFERMGGDLVGEIEAKVNAELAAGRDVRVNVLPRDEAFAIPDLIRTKVNLLPPGIEEIRTIEIVGLDLQADGGTHVANTREVGVDPGHRLRVEGPDQQADPDGARGGRGGSTPGPVVDAAESSARRRGRPTRMSGSRLRSHRGRGHERDWQEDRSRLFSRAHDSASVLGVPTAGDDAGPGAAAIALGDGVGVADRRVRRCRRRRRVGRRCRRRCRVG